MESLKKERSGSLLRTFLLIFAVSFLALGVMSCDMLPFFGEKSKEWKPSRKRATKKKKPEAEEKKAAEKEPEEPAYVYQPLDKTDPFVPFLREFTQAAKEEKKTGPTLPLTPLQKIDTTDFTLVAVVWGQTGKRAMVEDPAGKGYIIKKGTLIGRSNGKVKDILEDKVVVEEERLDALGNTVMKPVELRLPKTPLEIQEGTGLMSPALYLEKEEGAAQPSGAQEAKAEDVGEEALESELPSPEEELPQPPGSQP